MTSSVQRSPWNARCPKRRRRRREQAAQVTMAVAATHAAETATRGTVTARKIPNSVVGGGKGAGAGAQ